MHYTDDEEMFYDLKNHRYVLTQRAIESEYGINLDAIISSTATESNDETTQKFLNRVSRVLYIFIDSYAKDIDATRYFLIYNDSNTRERIKEALMELAYSWLVSNKDGSLMVNSGGYIPDGIKDSLLAGGICSRSKIIDLPENYLDLKGIDF